jgi:hypothetical protein
MSRGLRRGSRALIGALALVALTATGCGGSSDRAGAAGGSDTLDRLEGRYAHYDVVAYDGDMKTMIISYGFTDYDRVGDRLRSHDTFCFSEARTDQPVQISFSDAATRAIKPVPVDVTVTGTAKRAKVTRPETPTGIGVRLANPAKDPLPTEADDPRIADDDHDGKPGVTATITVTPTLKGEVYIARREIFAYDVTEQADGSLTGVVRDHSQQLVVGASDPIFEMSSGQWKQHPDLTKSPIILKPVGRSWNCARLKAERDRLFPPTPSVDY